MQRYTDAHSAQERRVGRTAQEICNQAAEHDIRVCSPEQCMGEMVHDNHAK